LAVPSPGSLAAQVFGSASLSGVSLARRGLRCPAPSPRSGSRICLPGGVLRRPEQIPPGNRRCAVLNCRGIGLSSHFGHLGRWQITACRGTVDGRDRTGRAASSLSWGTTRSKSPSSEVPFGQRRCGLWLIALRR